MHLYEVLRRPILTEKSQNQSDTMHRYTFEVDRSANKLQIKQAVQEIFKVTVLDVNILNMRGKSRRMGRFVGHTSDWKKAVVTIAEGQSIKFFEGV